MVKTENNADDNENLMAIEQEKIESFIQVKISSSDNNGHDDNRNLISLQPISNKLESLFPTSKNNILAGSTENIQ